MKEREIIYFGKGRNNPKVLFNPIQISKDRDFVFTSSVYVYYGILGGIKKAAGRYVLYLFCDSGSRV